MPTYRIGIGSEFNLKDRKVGIGSESPIGDLDVAGIIKSGNLYSSGISTLTTYSGFSALNKDKTSTTFDRNCSTESNIVVGVGETFIVSAGATVNVGSISDVKVGNTFGFPVGDIDDRPEVPVEGTVRFNRDLNTLEFYNGVEWRQFTVSGARGRCLAMGGSYGSPSNPATKVVHSIEISTLGNSIGFGNLDQEISQSGGGGNSIRAMTFGGSSPGGNRDYIQYGTIASSGTFEDFGNLSSQRQTVAAVSTSTRAVATAGATSGDTVQNILEFVEIATTGDAVDFGDLITRRRASGALGSPVRGVVVAGCTPTIFGNIEFFSPQSFGSAADWGEMDASRSPYAFSNSVRGIIAGGIHSFSPNTRRNGIDYLIIASAGTNVSDFGDLTLKRDAGGANGHSCNQTRGLICGGYANPGNADINTIDYITIETAGNAQDFGDMSASSWGYIANTTDSHGGLGGY